MRHFCQTGRRKTKRGRHIGPPRSGERGIRSRHFSQALIQQCITPKGAHRLRVAFFWTLVVVWGCLGSFGVISSTLSAQSPGGLSRLFAQFRHDQTSITRPSGFFGPRLRARSTGKNVRVRDKNWAGFPILRRPRRDLFHRLRRRGKRCFGLRSLGEPTDTPVRRGGTRSPATGYGRGGRPNCRGGPCEIASLKSLVNWSNLRPLLDSLSG